MKLTMNVKLYAWQENVWSEENTSHPIDLSNIKLILCYGDIQIMDEVDVHALVREKFPVGDIVIVSSVSTIFQNTVLTDALVVTVMEFSNTDISTNIIDMSEHKDYKTGIHQLLKPFDDKKVSYLMVYADGVHINGSELVAELNERVGEKYYVTGGLASSNSAEPRTKIGLNAAPSAQKVVAIAFESRNLFITHGSQGGWDVFGLEKTITKSDKNVLYQIDNEDALDLYKKYLGKEAENLPESALLFPLAIIEPGNINPIVRTILSINEEERSITFAGNMPEGSRVRYMKANFYKLIKAAGNAATFSLNKPKEAPIFALLISCVGRLLVLGPRVEEEIAAVASTMGDKTVFSGYYSNGEIAPFVKEVNCQIHNQTMTITSFYGISQFAQQPN